MSALVSQHLDSRSYVGLSSLTSWQEVVQAEMLPYMTSTNPYYFPAVIVPVLVLCLYQPRSTARTASDIPFTPGYSAAYTGSTKDTLTHSLPRPEVHSTCNYYNCSFFSSIFSDPGDPSLIVCKSGGRRPGESYHMICGMTCCHISSQQPSDVQDQSCILC